MRKTRPQKPMPRMRIECRFCENGDEPTYKKWEVLAHYISERGKVVPKMRSGLCSKHQRHIAQEIKRARHLALLPYLVRPS